MATTGEVYRTPTLATVPAARLAAVVEEYRRELVVLARDHAYAGANWALELIDSLAGRIDELERALSMLQARPAVYVEAAPVEPVEPVEPAPAPAEVPARTMRRVRG